MARRRRGTRRNRTRRGHVSAAARRRYGSGRGGRSFPVFDSRSARSALRLRGHSKKLSRGAVISKVSRYANRTHNASLKAAVRRARAADRRRRR
jgi:hypothetical protein